MKKAFTLIELIVTISIIVMMILIAVPAFSRYGKEMQYKQTIDQISIFLNEASVSALNPEQGIKSYVVVFDFSNSKLIFQKKLTDDTLVDIRELKLSKKQTILSQDDFQLMHCDVVDRGICKKLNSDGTQDLSFPDVLGGSNIDNVFVLKDDNIGKQVMIKAYNNPFRVDYE